jgi:glycosyltransferase involved in cell wall biosynthesis
METPTQKIKVLALCDYACATGFATVSSNIMRELYKMDKFDVDIVAINANGDPYDTNKFPFQVYPAVTLATLSAGGSNVDVYGRDKFLKMLAGGNYDVVFMIQDTFIIQSIMAKMEELIADLPHKPKTILYYPIDVTPDPVWINDVVAKIDIPVPYTEYAKAETLAINPDIKLHKPIYHGTNTDDFTYIEDRKMVDDFRHEWFDRGLADNRFTIMNLNRNQPRKDIFRSLQILKALRELGDDETLLYLHMQFEDAGGNIIKQAEQLGLEIGKDYVLPHPRVFNTHDGVDVPTLNMIYNAVDLVISTTHGEGWGLSITEAFATRTAVIAPDNTSLHEMLADDRGILIPCGETNEAWIVRESDNNRIRPIVSVDKFAKAILEFRAGKKVPNIDNAYDFAHKYTWENVSAQWGKIFLDAGNLTKSETKSRLLDQERKAKAGTHGSSKKNNRKKERQNRKGGR